MKTSSKSLALRIALLVEEHTAKEIRDAIAILRRSGETSELLAYLNSTARPPRTQGRTKSSSSGGKTKPLDQITSKAVRELEKSDPAKHRLLSEFDRLVRQGNVLSTNDSVRRFGERISKNFRPRTAKKDNISALMVALAQLGERDLENSLRYAFDMSSSQQTDDFQRLAKFLIEGKQE